MDEIVYDMSKQSEASPQIFVKKDWINILDNQNGSYNGNQSVIDTSQLSNSNKYMNYREGYLTVPLLLTATSPLDAGANLFLPATAGTSADYVFGLKNWYGSIVHSMTLDLNGTTIIQQTPYSGMWNTFKLMTSLSLDDLKTQGSAIGFYPDTADAVGVLAADSRAGTAGSTVHNSPVGAFDVVGGAFNPAGTFNEGLLRRQQAWNFDRDGVSSGGALFSTLISADNLNLLWKSYIFTKVDATAAVQGVFQVAITAIIKLKHLHSFFDRIPLAKGLFFKMTLNLNQSSVDLTTGAGSIITACAVNSPLGGVSPIMVCADGVAASLPPTKTLRVSLAVGGSVLNSAQRGTVGVADSPLGRNIILNVPAYTFAPTYESAYLSAPVKKIDYCDIYQYQVLNIASQGVVNQLISNGIAGVKSVLALPFYTAAANGGVQPIQSPFEGAGAGPTSPLCLLTNFNIQLSGQNQIYNTQRYSLDQFQNQLYGHGAVSSGQLDGLTSGLVGKSEFEKCFNYYYVSCDYGLPVEKDVPKSVNILGTNTSAKAIDLFVFVEYETSVSVDILTGSRV
jgi:hypothetical protein